MRTRIEDIRRDLSGIDQIKNAPGIRTKEDQRRLGSGYLWLALDCVRARMFVELEPMVMMDVQQKPENMVMSM